MAAGDLITLPWQVEVNDLLLGPGTEYVIRRFDPWAAPEIRSGNVGRAAADGSWPGRDRLGDRLVGLDVYIQGVDAAAQQQARRRLAAAFRPPGADVTVPLVWREDSADLWRLNGKPQLASSESSPALPTECRFVATDPRILSNIERSSGAVSPAAATAPGVLVALGGLEFDASPDFTFGSSVGPQTFAAENRGTVDAAWTASFTGVLSNPVLMHLESGTQMSFTGTVADGETLVVDSATRSVSIGGSSRYWWLNRSSVWFPLQPGVNTLMFLGGLGGACTVVWRDSWV
jgi:hypothetical protein